MHPKSSFIHPRLVVLAIGVSAILMVLAFGPHKSGAAPAVQGKKTFGTTGQSRRVGSRPSPRTAQQPSQKSVNTSLDEIKLTNSDGDVDEDHPDFAGLRVAISGTTAVVGTLQQRTLVFERRGNNWEQQQTLPVGGGEDFGGGDFGDAYGLAIDGGTMVIGTTGSTYVYVRQGTSWLLQAALPRPNNSHSFGQRLAISGDTIMVADPRVDDEHGAVWIYERSGTTWSGPQKLTGLDRSTDPTERGDQFGYAVAIEGDTAIVTAPVAVVVEGTPVNAEQGAAYVFVRSGGTWIEQAYLTANEDELANTNFMGPSVDLSGDTAIIGDQDSDAAFIFVRNGTTWSEQQRLTAFPGQGGQGFGVGVAISGERIVVGEHLGDERFGVAIIYDRTGETWFEGETLRPTTGVPSFTYIAFGYAVGMSGDTILVGAPFEHVGLLNNQGAAYVFQKRDTDGDSLADDWEEQGITVNEAGRVVGTGNLEGQGTFIDLPRMGADPMHKDLFVHLDWMEPDPERPEFEFKPDPRAIKIVVDSFAIAPVENPDGEPGINLHVDFGPDSTMNPVNGEEWGDFSEAGELPFVASVGFYEGDEEHPVFNWSEVDDLKETYFKPAGRGAVFHYVLFCDAFAESNKSGVSRGIPATDFIVALGHPDGPPPSRTELEVAGTFMHEFGHNLGLLHGGNENVNRKPNYLSVMNYSFQKIGLLKANGQRSFDYSREALPDLNEDGEAGGLIENVGIDDPEMHFTLWKCPAPDNTYFKKFLPSEALDWDLDGVQSAVPVEEDINCDEDKSTLTGFSDWPVIIFSGDGKIGDLAGASHSDSIRSVSDELPRQQLLAAVPPALLTEELAAPKDVVTFLPRTGSDPLPVNFDGSASTAVGGTIVNWSWNFGDGTTGAGATVAHTYPTAGVYFASLTVTDSNGHVNLVPLLHRVTVTNQHPNLAPFQPPAWSDKIVVSTVTGTNTDSAELTTNDILYIDSAVINNGTAPTAVDFVTRLYVDGVETQTFLASAPLNVNFITGVQDIAIGPLSAGPHTLKIVADANATIVETDESDNEYSRVINITGANPSPSPTPTGQPNLTPYQPSGWSDKIVVSNITGTNADSATFNTTDTLFVDWAAINNGGAATTGVFETKLYVDGVEKNTRVTSGTINPGGSFGAQDITIGSLSAGQHAVRIVLDTGGAITEGNETDNEYVKTFSVLSPLPTPSPTPTPLPVSQTYTATNTNDSGPGSLRQALIDANNHPNGGGGIDQIVFNIPGSGVHTITPITAFPVISDAVLIDGYTQPGASANTRATGNDAVLLIELNFVNVISSAAGLNFTGGSSTLRGLVINNFNSQIAFASAIRLASSNNVVAGNFIGTNAAGTSMAPNSLCGIAVDSGANNLVGGSVPADRNIMAGSATQNETSGGVGIQITTTQPGTRIQGNYIGTNAAGNAALGYLWGINVDSKASSDITIGGLTDTPGMGVGNVISGNSSNGGIASNGIHIYHRPRGDVRIQGNLIGLNATGTEALSNGISGITIEDAASGTFIPDPTPGTGIILIGGAEPGARNVIFNNRISGIVINLGIFSSAAASVIQVQGNFIGTDITGTINPPIGVGSHSGGNGMTIYSDGSVTIGGNSAAARNVISCRGRGLLITGGFATVQGNYIGTTVDGSTPLGNQGAGVRVENDAVAIIGGTAPGQGNLIAHNFRAGVEVRNNARATILGNSIFDNGTQDVSTFQGHPGIDLNDNGVTPNDECDTDSGPNGLQNFPALTSAIATAGAIRFLGSLNSKPSTSFRIEFFSNPSCEVSGHGEGQTYVGSTTVSTTGSCNAGINVTLPSAVPVGQFISATATDADGNTSEFGPCVQVTEAVPTAANGSVSGQITEPNGNPLAGVTISLTGTQNRLTITDANGSYEFDNVETNAFYTVAPARVNYSFSPTQRSFSLLGNKTDVAFTAMADSVETGNPLDAPEFFVRQQYLDFLSREPDAGGFNYWTKAIAQCGSDTLCFQSRRIEVSNAFFREPEFQESGAYVYRLYKAALGLDPLFAQFRSDHELVVGGPQLDQSKSSFALAFVQRDSFVSAYPRNQTADQFVEALLNSIQQNSGADLTRQRAGLLVLYDGTDKGRAAILRELADDESYVDAEYNRSFVLTQYFGYLRRDPDQSGFQFWLDQVNSAPLRDLTRQHAMICSFITSTEYQLRFSSVVTQGNTYCR